VLRLQCDLSFLRGQPKVHILVYQVIDNILRAASSWRMYKCRPNKAFCRYEAIIGALAGVNVSGTAVPFGSVEGRASSSVP
jgi:hypothetical protein